jgi:hypothetical protein
MLYPAELCARWGAIFGFILGLGAQAHVYAELFTALSAEGNSALASALLMRIGAFVGVWAGLFALAGKARNRFAQ